jgi:glycine/D-amino acid oxidase-like deaminating enzyme
MPSLLIVGGGLFGSMAAAYARRRGIEARVFDPQWPGAASPAAAGLFQDAWIGRKLRDSYRRSLPVLDELYGLRQVILARPDGGAETLTCVPPTVVLEKETIRQEVTAIGDGWLEAGGERHEGWIYVAAGVWCQRFFHDLRIHGRGGAAFLFPAENPGQIRTIGHGRQAIAFVRELGATYFSDGTAERDYTEEHDRLTLSRAAEMGLTGPPSRRLWGLRPYVPGGPVFQRQGRRIWLATGGRKMGTILAAACARRLVEEELSDE